MIPHMLVLKLVTGKTFTRLQIRLIILTTIVMVRGDYRGNWLDFLSLSTFNIPVGSTLIELKFTTLTDQGSPLTFSVSKEVDGNFAAKVATEMLDENFTNATLTLNNGSIFFGGVVNEWTGAIDNDWFNPGNWSLSVVPVAEDVEIPVTAKGNPVIFGGSASTGALTVFSGAGLAVDYTGDLTTNGLFTCDGDFEIYTENLTGYSGSFIPTAG